MLSKVDGIPRYLRQCCAETKTALGIIQLWFIYFAASFLKALGIQFSREAKDKDATVIRAFPPVSLLVHGDDHPSWPIFRRPSRTPGRLKNTSQPKNPCVSERWSHKRNCRPRVNRNHLTLDLMMRMAYYYLLTCQLLNQTLSEESLNS